MKKIISSLSLISLVVFAILNTQASTLTKATSTSSSLPTLCALQGKDMIPVRMIIEFTNKYHRSESGYIDICLNHGAAPVTVNNFLKYVNSGFYNHTTFHRIIAGFIDQSGGYGYTQTPQGYNYHYKIPKYSAIRLETTKKTGLSNLEGTIAMARSSDPNSAQSQFYFNVEENSRLDYQSPKNPGYAVFGAVADTQSMQLLYDLSQVPVEKVRLHVINKQQDFPKYPVLVKSVVSFKPITLN